MFRVFQLVGVIFLVLGFSSITNAQVAKVVSGGIVIPISECTQVYLKHSTYAVHPPQLESLLTSLGYGTNILQSYYANGVFVSYVGTSAADTWAQTTFSQNPDFSLAPPRYTASIRRYTYEIVNNITPGNYGVIVEQYTDYFDEMLADYSKAVDKQAWTNNIASQLQGVSTSVDANGDGIIVTPIPQSYSASISVQPIKVRRGDIITGVLTASSTGLCPITGTATLDIYGQTRTLNISKAGDTPFTFSSASLPFGGYAIKATKIKLNNHTVFDTSSFVQVLPAPIQVSLSLDKAKASTCGDTINGKIIITDPNGKGGNAQLTLPSGTVPYYYTGSSDTYTFSYKVNQPAGTVAEFQASAHNLFAQGTSASATASANIIAGGLNVTITSAKTVVEPTLNNLRSWMQTAGANQTSVIIDVKDPNNQPVTNAQFTVLGVETVPGAETYGGHDHATDPNNALTKPTGTWGAIKNLGNGQYSSTYTASMFASMEQLYATVSAGGCDGLAVSPPIEAKTQGLQPIILPLGGLVHSFVGGTCNHYGATTPWSPNKLTACNGTTGTSNIYLTAFRENLLHQLLFAYAKEWNAGLYINDASLKFGGAFDTNGDWAYKPHSNHRLGLDVDIALKENIPPISTAPTNISGKTLKRKLDSIILSDPLLKGKWVASLHKNHIHLKPNFKTGNWTGK